MRFLFAVAVLAVVLPIGCGDGDTIVNTCVVVVGADPDSIEQCVNENDAAGVPTAAPDASAPASGDAMMGWKREPLCAEAMCPPVHPCRSNICNGTSCTQVPKEDGTVCIGGYGHCTAGTCVPNTPQP